MKKFSFPLKLFHAHEELGQLDSQVNEFLASSEVKKVISVSDLFFTPSLV